MKNIFFEYYPINKEVIERAWNEGIFCYDANVLLNLYRYTNETRNKIFENIEYFIERTIMPYQACYEYHKNKRNVEDSLQNSYDEIIKIIEHTINTLESGDLAKYRKHCVLDIDKDIIKPIKSTTTRITEKINDYKRNHSSSLNAIEIHEKISQLFDNKISNKFSEEDLKKIYSEGKSRYEKKIPPGFADYNSKKNLEENNLYGDLIIWKHLIEISKLKNRDIIFITDDRKPDWWDIHGGKIKGALPALYREFKKLTSHNILIYSVEDYMKYAPQHSAIAVSKKVITEIEELRKVDERRKTYLDYDSISKIMKQLNKQNEIWVKINKQNEIFQALSPQNKFIDYSKSMEDINKAIQRINQTPKYSEFINNMNKFNINDIIWDTKVDSICKTNEDDE